MSPHASANGNTISARLKAQAKFRRTPLRCKEEAARLVHSVWNRVTAWAGPSLISPEKEQPRHSAILEPSENDTTHVLPASRRKAAFMGRTAYRRRQEQIRSEAIAWQTEFADKSWSMDEIVEQQAYFHRLGRRFGLLREFHENAVC